jgi:hypothetical protein
MNAQNKPQAVEVNQAQGRAYWATYLEGFAGSMIRHRTIEV